MTNNEIEKLLKKNKTKDVTTLLLTNPISEWWDIIEYNTQWCSDISFKPDSLQKKQLLDIVDANRKEFDQEEIWWTGTNWKKYYGISKFLDKFTTHEIIHDIIMRFFDLENTKFNENMLNNKNNIGLYIEGIWDRYKSNTELADYFNKILKDKTSLSKVDLFSILYCFNCNYFNRYDDTIFDNVIFTDDTYKIIKKYQNKIMQKPCYVNTIKNIAIRNKSFIIESLKYDINIFNFVFPLKCYENSDPLYGVKNITTIIKEYFNDEKKYMDYMQKCFFNKVKFNDFIKCAEDPFFRKNLKYMISEKQSKIREYFEITDSLSDDCPNEDAFKYTAKLTDNIFYKLITNKTRNLSNATIKKLVFIRVNTRASEKVFSNYLYNNYLLKSYPEIYYQIIGSIKSQKLIKSDPLLNILKESGMIKGIEVNIIPNDDVDEEIINMFLQLSDKI